MRVQTFVLLVVMALWLTCQASDLKKKKKGPPVYVSTVVHQWPSDWPAMVKKNVKDGKGGLGHLSLAQTEEEPQLHQAKHNEKKKDKKN